MLRWAKKNLGFPESSGGMSNNLGVPSEAPFYVAVDGMYVVRSLPFVRSSQ
jgi:hypothetical protein